MRNKQVIEQLIERTNQTIDFLHKDIDSNKPHVTTDYVKNQLAVCLRNLDTTQQYLSLEE